MFLLSVECWAQFVMYVHKGVFFYQRWLFCTFLEIFNLYTDLILWPIVDGCMRITYVCNVLLSGCMGFFITFEMLLPVTALLLLLYMEYLVYKKKDKNNFKISLWLWWLRNSGVGHCLLVPLSNNLPNLKTTNQPRLVILCMHWMCVYIYPSNLIPQFHFYIFMNLFFKGTMFS